MRRPVATRKEAHPDGFFPGAPKLSADRPELSPETKRQILAGGAKGFHALTERSGYSGLARSSTSRISGEDSSPARRSRSWVPARRPAMMVHAAR